ncbi:MAG: V-type ATPase subunit [Candidatus Nanohaloarchaea archaeon]
MIIERDYPYMYARVSAKKAKLLEKNDYENLLKMEPNEIARQLQEGEYNDDIDDLGAKHDGVELVELALMRNVSRTMSELIEMSPESLKSVLQAYLRRYDLMSFKRLLRWKKGGEMNGIESFLVPVGRYDLEDLRELSERSFDEIKDAIRFPESEVDYHEAAMNADTLKDIERDLDRKYYEEMKKLQREINSNWFSKFINDEIRYENLKIALRLKKYEMEESDIQSWLVTDDKDDIKEVLNAKDLGSALDAAKSSGLIDSDAGETLEEVEHSIEVSRLNRALKTLHVEPLGVTSILGYIVAKLIEVKNLRMLIRAKETGIQNLETIRGNLVLS